MSATAQIATPITTLFNSTRLSIIFSLFGIQPLIKVGVRAYNNLEYLSIIFELRSQETLDSQTHSAIILDMPIDITSLSFKTGIPEEKANEVWQDFVNELNSTISSNKEFIYPDIVSYTPPLPTFSSNFVLGLIMGEISFEDFISSIDDPRKANFARVVYFILDQASFGPVTYESLGTFYLFGKLPKVTKNPQSGELVKTPLMMNLGFKPLR